jgi:hypothetical protein
MLKMWVTVVLIRWHLQGWLTCPILLFVPKLVGVEWHKQDYLMGDCLSCGINTLKVYPTEELHCVSKMVQWQWYSKVVIGQKDNDDDQKVTQLQYMDTPTSKLLDYPHPKLKEFVTHNFVAKWEDKVQHSLPY